jgi:hypothetical protein
MGERDDIEDVVSSIRRLVAEEARARAEAPARSELEAAMGVAGPHGSAGNGESRSAGASAQPSSERLVLGADRRVDASPGRVDGGSDHPASSAKFGGTASSEPRPAEPPLRLVSPVVLPLGGPRNPDEPSLPVPAPQRGLDIPEEELRGMIAEIVREELSGPLGERITRNVRKLVRREIRSMLMGEDRDGTS